jgi:hypothetical protein
MGHPEHEHTSLCTPGSTGLDTGPEARNPARTRTLPGVGSADPVSPSADLREASRDLVVDITSLVERLDELADRLEKLEARVSDIVPPVAEIPPVAASLARIANALAPAPPDLVGTGYVAQHLGCTAVWVAEMARQGQIPKHCLAPGTGNGKPWKFYRGHIDRWLASR